MYWNVFDLILVILSTIDLILSSLETLGAETRLNLNVLRLLRVLRAVRAVRIVRAVRFFSHLRLLISGLIGAMHSLSGALCLLLMIIYVFGISFTQATTDYLTDTGTFTETFDAHTTDLQTFFGTLPRSIFTLYKAICGGQDWDTFS
jgi:hypothetical protein